MDEEDNNLIVVQKGDSPSNVDRNNIQELNENISKLIKMLEEKETSLLKPSTEKDGQRINAELLFDSYVNKHSQNFSKKDVFELNDVLNLRIPMFSRERFNRLKNFYPRIKNGELFVVLLESFLTQYSINIDEEPSKKDDNLS